MPNLISTTTEVQVQELDFGPAAAEPGAGMVCAGV